MPYVNKIEIMGNLGRNPELRYMPDGRAVTNVSVAVQKTLNDRETHEQKERTEWFSVILYGGQAETVCRLFIYSPIIIFSDLAEAIVTQKERGDKRKGQGST